MAASKVRAHELLIRAVREHEVLYNSDMKEYNDNILKMRLWRQIARKCDINSGEEAKKIWKNLRDGYRCSIKTLKLYENKEPPRSLKPWKYSDLMEFLRPYMKDRVFSNSAYYEDEIDGDALHAAARQYAVCGHMEDNGGVAVGAAAAAAVSDDNTHGSIEETIECRPDIGLLPSTVDDDSRAADDDDGGGSVHDKESDSAAAAAAASAAYAMSQCSAMLAAAALPQQRRRSRKRRVDHVMDMPMLPDDQNGYEQQDDGLKLFFDAMYASTRELPRHLQRVVRTKLFQAVNEAEIAADSMDLYPNNHLTIVYGQQPPAAAAVTTAQQAPYTNGKRA